MKKEIFNKIGFKIWWAVEHPNFKYVVVGIFGFILGAKIF